MEPPTPDDADILKEEDERERLISGEGGENVERSRKAERKQNKKDRRRRERASGRARRRRGESQDVMYEMEMEEGTNWTSGDSERNEERSSEEIESEEADRETLGLMRGKRQSRRSRIFGFTVVHVLIVIFFLGLLFAAYKASHKRPAVDLAKMVLSNGTENFAPTTILISLDGFRADFLKRGLTPTLNAFIQDGVSPHYMLPAFPSVTFPNHFTLVTGLHPESHGVVGNTFWDPELQEEFYYTDPKRSMQPKWWKGDPIWVTAEDQGVRSAIHMWPGSEAHIGDFEPTYIDNYNGKEKLSRKVDRILGLLDIPGPDSPHAEANTPRPQLIAAYVPNVDADGHLYGPNSTEIRSTIRDVDEMLNDIFAGLEQRNLTSIVNVVVVSDHGMATTSNERLLQLEDFIDTSLIEHIDGWPLYGLRPKRASDLEPLYNLLKEKAKEIDSIEVYLRDEDMPERYHFAHNDRIAPLWIVPKAGWAVVTKDEFDVKKGLETGDVYHPRGLHGYDHENPLMRAIFVARGPAFPHKPGSRVENFQNIEVYNIVCDSLGIVPTPNNGTLRLPLKPVGFHSDEGVTTPNVPDDPPASPNTVTEPIDRTPVPSQGLPDDPGEPHEDDESPSRGWAAWITNKYHKAKDWAWGIVNKDDPGRSRSR